MTCFSLSNKTKHNGDEMKGTARRPLWPAPAHEAKKNNPSHQPETIAANDPKPLSAITLALLDEYSPDSHTRGYDPYNKQATPGSFARNRRKL